MTLAVSEGLVEPDESPAAPPQPWRQRLNRLGALVRRALPFASGVLAAFVALLLYNAFVPRPPQLTAQQVSETVAQTLASATPAPSYSAQVYQVIRPSLVLIQTERP